MLTEAVAGEIAGFLFNYAKDRLTKLEAYKKITNQIEIDTSLNELNDLLQDAVKKAKQNKNIQSFNNKELESAIRLNAETFYNWIIDLSEDLTFDRASKSLTYPSENEETRKLLDTFFNSLFNQIRAGLKNKSTLMLLRSEAGQKKIQETIKNESQETRDLIGSNIHTFQKYIDAEKNSNLNKLEFNAKSQFYYRSGAVSFVGRERELAVLESFRDDPDTLKWIAVTGPGGSGKSRLVFEFLRNNQTNTEWSMLYLNWTDYKEEAKSNGFKKDFRYPQNLLLVIDYILGAASEIGKWINYIFEKRSDLSHKIRIILIEREVYTDTDEDKPVWFKRLLESVSVYHSHIEEVKYKEFITVSSLSDADLVLLVQKYLKNQNREPSEEIIKDRILKPLREIDKEKQRPIYLLYIIEAWIQNEPITHWDKKQLGDWINQQEIKRIDSLVNGNNLVSLNIQNLLAYATAVSRLDNNNLPVFLKSDWQKLQLYCNNNNTNLFNIFKSLNIDVGDDSLHISGIVPDIMGEYFCLYHLNKRKFKNTEPELINLFAQSAWEKNPYEYAQFLSRITDDFPDDKLSSHQYLYQAPKKSTPGNDIGYLWLLSRLALNENETKSTFLEKQVMRLKPRLSETYSLILSSGIFVNLSNAYPDIEDKKRCVDELKALAVSHSDVYEILTAYAKGLVILVYNYCASGNTEAAILNIESNIELFLGSNLISYIFTESVFKDIAADPRIQRYRNLPKDC